MSKRSVVTFMLMLIAGAAAPLYAQEAAAAGAASADRSREVVDHHGRIRSGVRRRARGARPGPRRQRGCRRHRRAIPRAAGDIRGSLLLGLVLIESLAIYVLLISLILFFVNPFVA